VRTFQVDFFQQRFVPLNLIALFCSDCGEIEFYKVGDVVSSISESPVESVEAAAEVDNLTLVASFLRERKEDDDKLHGFRSRAALLFVIFK
jgi:hypothetical protein